jgi:hypothetical protein
MSSENSKKNNLLTEMRDLMRHLHYSIHTENAYCDWVAKYVHFHKMQVREAWFVEPEKQVEDYLTYLAARVGCAEERSAS